jgi:ElaB/YqjD/DUF883 family membrane-anchored ribosome-binding protein
MNNNLQETAEELSNLKDAILSIGAAVTEVLNLRLEDTSTVLQRIQRTIRNDINKSFTELAKGTDRILKNQIELNRGLLTEKTIAKQLQKIEGDRAALALNLEIARRNYVDAANIDDTERIRRGAELNGIQYEVTEQLRLQEEILRRQQGELEQIEKKSGAVLRGLQLFSKIPGLGSYLDLDGLTEEIRAKAGDSSTSIWQIFKTGIKGVGQAFLKVIEPQALIAVFAKILGDVDRLVTKVARAFGVSKSEANEVAKSLTNIALKSKDTFLSTEMLAESFQTLNSRYNTFGKFGKESLETFTQLVKKSQLTAEAAGALYDLSIISNKPYKAVTQQLTGQLALLKAQNKSSLNLKVLQEDVKNLSAAVKLQFAGSGDALANVIFKTRRLGMELKDLESASASLLNFQSSIEDELAAELLSGRQLNLEGARYAALIGDQALLADELAATLGTAADFTGRNVLEQEAIAKTLGLNRESLAQILLQREALNKLDAEGNTLQERYNNLRKKGISEEEIAKQLGSETLQQQLETLTITERWNSVMTRLQEPLVRIAEAILPIVDGFASLVSNAVLLNTTIGLVTGLIGGRLIGNLVKAVAVMATYVKLNWNGARASMADAAAKVAASSAMVPIVGAITAGLAVASIVAMLAPLFKANDLFSEGGYGKRVLLAPEGAFALNDRDNIIATTNKVNLEDTTSIRQEQAQTAPVRNAAIDRVDLTPLVGVMKNLAKELKDSITGLGNILQKNLTDITKTISDRINLKDIDREQPGNTIETLNNSVLTAVQNSFNTLHISLENLQDTLRNLDFAKDVEKIYQQASQTLVKNLENVKINVNADFTESFKNLENTLTGVVTGLEKPKIDIILTAETFREITASINNTLNTNLTSSTQKLLETLKVQKLEPNTTQPQPTETRDLTQISIVSTAVERLQKVLTDNTQAILKALQTPPGLVQPVINIQQVDLTPLVKQLGQEINTLTVDTGKQNTAVDRLTEVSGKTSAYIQQLLQKPVDTSNTEGLYENFRTLSEKVEQVLSEKLTQTGRVLEDILQNQKTLTKNTVDNVVNMFADIAAKLQQPFNQLPVDVTQVLANIADKIEQPFNQLSTTVNETFTRLISKIEEPFSQFSTTASEMFTNIISKIEKPFDQVSTTVGETFTALVNRIEEPFNQLTTIVNETFTELASKIEEPFNQLSTTINETFTELASKIEQPFNRMSTIVNETFTTLADKLEQPFGEIASNVNETFSSIAKNLKEPFDQLTLTVGEMFTNILEKIQEPFGQLSSTVGEMFTNISEKIQEPFNQMSSTVGEVFTNILEKIQEPFGQLSSTVGEMFTNISEKIQEPFNQMSSTINETFTKLVSKIEQPFNQLSTEINNTVTEISNQIKEPFNQLSSTAGQLFADTANQIKEPFSQILSSTREMFANITNDIEQPFKQLAFTVEEMFTNITAKVEELTLQEGLQKLTSTIPDQVTEKLNSGIQKTQADAITNLTQPLTTLYQKVLQTEYNANPDITSEPEILKEVMVKFEDPILQVLQTLATTFETVAARLQDVNETAPEVTIIQQQPVQKITPEPVVQRQSEVKTANVVVNPSDTTINLNLNGSAIGNAMARQNYKVSNHIKAFGGPVDFSVGI